MNNEDITAFVSEHNQYYLILSNDQDTAFCIDSDGGEVEIYKNQIDFIERDGQRFDVSELDIF
jgi:hypothetical protein